MNNRDFSNIGDQIRETVQNAIDSMDFNQVNRTISDTANRALEEARRQLFRDRTVGSTPRYKDEVHRSRRWSGKWCRRESVQGMRREAAEDEDRVYERQVYRKPVSPGGVSRDGNPAQAAPLSRAKQLLRDSRPGKIQGILYTVFGGVGLGISAVLLLVVLLVGLILKPVWGALLGVSVFLAVLGGVSGVFLGRGIAMRGRLRRLKLYLLEAGDKTYCSVADLAKRVGRSPKYVVRDLQKMIEGGLLPDGYIDDQKTCLMLDKETYRQYRDLMKAQEEKRLEAEKDSGKEEPVQGELEEAMKAGRDYLRSLKEANEAIPGEVISAKLDRLESVIRRIFDSVEKNPEQLPEIRKFMEYYLPTTVKLVNAYRDFDDVKIQGDNITMAKSEVEGTLDTINQAFERLLDDLYREAAFDVSTDATVLQTMLKKDGFAGSDFDRRTGS